MYHIQPTASQQTTFLLLQISNWNFIFSASSNLGPPTCSGKHGGELTGASIKRKYKNNNITVIQGTQLLLTSKLAMRAHKYSNLGRTSSNAEQCHPFFHYVTMPSHSLLKGHNDTHLFSIITNHHSGWEPLKRSLPCGAQIQLHSLNLCSVIV